MNLGSESSPLSTWDDIFLAYSDLIDSADPNETWVFRGQGKGSHKLVTSLDRAFIDFEISPDKALKVEERVMREFRRRYSHYKSKEPHPLDRIAWWSIMQHYGSPTRLLDWTYSFYVALFFAIEKATDEKTCKVFAYPANSLRRTMRFNQEELEAICSEFKKKAENITAIGDESWIEGAAVVDHLLKKPRKLVVLVSAFRLNSRLSIQQGVFIMPGDIRMSFDVNASSAPVEVKEIFISADVELRRKVLMRLRRMNINRATLFGGLAGYAESLYTRLAEHQLLSE